MNHIEKVNEILNRRGIDFNLVEERCPKCGDQLLKNKEGIIWCSFAECDYGHTPHVRISRLDQINERVKEFKQKWKISRGCCEIEDFSDDVQYLLSKLEIAEKALSDAIQEMELMDATIENDHSVGDWEPNEVVRQVKEALKQLRE